MRNGEEFASYLDSLDIDELLKEDQIEYSHKSTILPKVNESPIDVLSIKNKESTMSRIEIRRTRVINFTGDKPLSIKFLFALDTFIIVNTSKHTLKIKNLYHSDWELNKLSRDKISRLAEEYEYGTAIYMYRYRSSLLNQLISPIELKSSEVLLL